MCIDIELCDLQPALAGISKHLPSEMGRAFPGRDDFIHEAGVPFANRFGKKVCIPKYDGQEVIKIMSNAAGHKPQAFQPSGFAALLLLSSLELFGFFPLGNIAEDQKQRFSSAFARFALPVPRCP